MSRVSLLIPKFLLALLAGVFLASYIVIPSVISVFLLGVAVVSLAVGYRLHASRAFLVAVCALGLLLGISRFTLWRDAPMDKTLTTNVGAFVELRGIISDEPDVREGNTHLTVAVQQLGSATSAILVFGNTLAIVPRYPEYNYGDEIVLRGKLTLPEAFTERDGRVFDYPAYLRTKDIRYQMMYPKTEKVSEENGNRIITMLFAVKHRFIEALGRALPEPESALAGGLLLGGKRSLGAEWMDRFRTAGIVHIVVLSGYNMTIVAEWLVVAFRFLGFFGSLGVGALGIVLFALMTGAGATVVRGAIMAILVLVARATGRTATMGRALLIAGVAMVLVNPSILFFDPSFQLSFLASLGLVFVSPLIERRINILKNYPTLREVLVSTLATQVTVLPLLLYQTGMLSLVSLPANLLVLPFIPLTMLFSFIAGVISLCIPFIAIFTALPAHMMLMWILAVARYAAELPLAALAVGNILPYIVVCAYIALAWVIAVFTEKDSRARSVALQHPPLRSREAPHQYSASDKKDTQ